jgi:hypothetical protein
MGKYLDLAEEVMKAREPEPPLQDPCGTFGTPQGEDAAVFELPPQPTIADRYPADELGDPCPDCGSKEKWRWHHGRLLCRACLIRGGPPREGEVHSLDTEASVGRQRQWW